MATSSSALLDSSVPYPTWAGLPPHPSVVAGGLPTAEADDAEGIGAKAAAAVKGESDGGSDGGSDSDSEDDVWAAALAAAAGLDTSTTHAGGARGRGRGRGAATASADDPSLTTNTSGGTTGAGAGAGAGGDGGDDGDGSSNAALLLSVPEVPHPAIECLRQRSLRSLQQRFEKILHAAGMKVKDSATAVFERWMFGQRLHADNVAADPVLVAHPQHDNAFRQELTASRMHYSAAKRWDGEVGKAAKKAYHVFARQVPDTGSLDTAHNAVKMKVDTDSRVVLKHNHHGKVEVRVNPAHYDKLRALYDAAGAAPDDTSVDFIRRVFCLLVRYDAVKGGGGFHAAIHDTCFDVLRKHFDVRMECFASPLNCRFPHYCSAYPDTDRAFGSVGSFFDLHPKEGSYEANPPFVPLLVERMAMHMDRLLRGATGPLSFVVIIPAWKDEAAWKDLESSSFLRHHLVLDQASHGYTEGSQHWRSTRFRISTCDTSVFWLQNDAGAAKWPVTDAAKEELAAAFAPRHVTLADKRAAKAKARGATDGTTGDDSDDGDDAAVADDSDAAAAAPKPSNTKSGKHNLQKNKAKNLPDKAANSHRKRAADGAAGSKPHAPPAAKASKKKRKHK